MALPDASHLLSGNEVMQALSKLDHGWQAGGAGGMTFPAAVEARLNAQEAGHGGGCTWTKR